jgi:anti-sigma28 factor (negative regulator of flagellin synthesis)
VTFDEDKTDLETMKKALEKGDYPVSAEKLLN